jgi:hypothetical protein
MTSAVQREGNEVVDLCNEKRDEVDDQCREKFMRLRTMQREGDEVEDLCRQKGAGLMTSAEKRGRG